MQNSFSLLTQQDFWTIIHNSILSHKRKPYIQYVTYRNYTSLRSAIKYGYSEIASNNLVRKSTNLSYANLKYALVGGYIEMVKWIVENSTEDFRSETSYMNTAAKCGHLDCLKYLHEKKFSFGDNLVEKSVVRLHTHVVKWLHSMDIKTSSHKIFQLIVRRMSMPRIYSYTDRGEHRHYEMLKWLWKNYPDAITFETSVYLTRCKKAVKYYIRNKIVDHVKSTDKKGAISFFDKDVCCCDKISTEFISHYLTTYPIKNQHLVKYFVFSIRDDNTPLTKVLWKIAMKSYIEKCIERREYPLEIPIHESESNSLRWLLKQNKKFSRFIKRYRVGSKVVKPPKVNIAKVMNSYSKSPVEKTISVLRSIKEKKLHSGISIHTFFCAKKQYVNLRFFAILRELDMIKDSGPTLGISHERILPKQNFHIYRYIHHTKLKDLEHDSLFFIIEDLMHKNTRKVYNIIKWLYYNREKKTVGKESKLDALPQSDQKYLTRKEWTNFHHQFLPIVYELKDSILRDRVIYSLLMSVVKNELVELIPMYVGLDLVTTTIAKEYYYEAYVPDNIKREYFIKRIIKDKKPDIIKYLKNLEDKSWPELLEKYVSEKHEENGTLVWTDYKTEHQDHLLRVYEN